MPIFTPLRTAAASAVALAVATSVSIGLAATSAQPGGPAAGVDGEAIAQQAADQRAELITSRNADREALAASVVSSVEARSLALAETGHQIEATEQAIQAQKAAEKAAAEKAAAEKAAAEKAAAEKKAAEEAARPRGGTREQNKELGRQLAQEVYGWGGDQFSCYDNIIMRESLWDTTADNPTSSAYGIPQALPGKKMATEGADWETNPETQIRWGLKYVKERFGTPCKAWSFKKANGWY